MPAPKNPRIALLGYILETNGFAPMATEKDFRRTWMDGDAILEDAAAKAPREPGGFVGFISGMNASGAWTPVPLLYTSAGASGPMDQAFLDTFLEIVEDRLKAAMPFDGIYIQDHGAAGATVDWDPDGTLFALIRKVVGPDVPVIATLDLHANVSTAMVKNTDVLIAYLTNPHIDMVERGREAAFAMRELLAGVKTAKAFIQVPILPPQVALLSDRGPYGEAIDKGQKAAKGSILNVSVLGNCSFADSPKTGMSVIVTARENQKAADDLAKDLARYLWDQRHRLAPKVTSIEEATKRLKAVIADPTKKPLLFADCADNPGGGGRGNTTHILKAFLEAGIGQTVFAIHNDPSLAAEAHKRGVGARFQAQINRDEEHPMSGRLTVPAEVMAVSDGEIIGRRGTIGGRKASLGPSARLRLDGRIDVVFITIRQQCFDTEMIEHLGLKVRDLRGIVVKSRGHFRAGFNDIFTDDQIMEVDAPGLTTPVLQRLPWTNLRRPLWPLDADMSWQVPAEVAVR
ncbi:MAG: M81 family peptidase [Alphaproteobacteria bacterium]|nr:M81 family peptidase [Alphaproteobacteria bacterium]